MPGLFRGSGRNLAGTNQPLAWSGAVHLHHRNGCLVQQKDFAVRTFWPHGLNQAATYCQPGWDSIGHGLHQSRSERQPGWDNIGPRLCFKLGHTVILVGPHQPEQDKSRLFPPSKMAETCCQPAAGGVGAVVTFVGT